MVELQALAMARFKDWGFVTHGSMKLFYFQDYPIKRLKNDVFIFTFLKVLYG